MPQTLQLLRTGLATAALLLTTPLLFGQTLPPTSGKTEIKQYSVYAEGNHTGLTDSVNYGVRITDKAIVNGGFIGSNFYVGLNTGNNVTANIYSGNRISLLSGNTVNGSLFARNDANVKFKTINIGSGNNTVGSTSTSSVGSVYARGNVGVALSAGNTVRASVRIQKPFAYTGPAPASGTAQVVDVLDMPAMPTLPGENSFAAAGTANVSKTSKIGPGAYKDVYLNGRSTLTLSQPGVYVFKSIKTSGRNTIDFLFPSGSTGSYKLYVHEVVDLGPTQVTINGAGPATNGNFTNADRIYTEVHGTGNAFRIKDTAKSAGNFAYWAGTVYASKGGIVIGSGNGNDNYSAVYGALWSKTKIFLGNNSQIKFIPASSPTSVIDPAYPPLSTGKVYDNLGTELNIIGQSGDPSSLSNDVFRIDASAGKVMIEVVAKILNDQTLLAYLQSLGFEVVTSSPTSLVITGYLAFDKLALLTGRNDIDYVRPLFEPISNSGQVTTLGDTTMKSDAVRSRFGVQGAGVTVGILSDSYNNKGGADNDKAEGDVPANLVVAKDFPGGRTDEGRAMAQIVYDVAPKSNIVFRTGSISPLDFALGIKELALPPYNSNVIVDDITWITEPFFKDGLVAQTVNNVVLNNKVSYFSAAGNFGSKSYEGTYSPLTGNTGLPAGIPGIANSFGGTARQKIHLKKGSYVIELQWDDNFYSLGNNSGAAIDLDLYLVKPDGSYFGFNRDNRTGDPFEILGFTANEETDADLLVVQEFGTSPVKFKCIFFRGEATIPNYAGSPTIVGQANAENAIAVGAMLYGNVNNIVPDYPSVASFSSRGGVEVAGSKRQKPDLVGPNGVNTTVVLNPDPSINIDNDPYPNFFGTSAAAPHVAAAAALFIEGKKKFNLQASVLQSEVRDTLEKTAKDLHQPGFDYNSGYGAVQADAAMLTIANARPIISALVPPAGLTPSNTTDFTVKVKGRYLNNKTKIYLRGKPITTAFVNTEEVTATITGAIKDDPPIQLFNEAKSISGLDGGLSEPLFFFSNRKLVTVTADNKAKKYGETLPQFTATVTIDGVPLAGTGVSLVDLKLDGANLGFTTLATPTSSVANYSITPYRTVELNPANSTDAAILNQYYFLFVPGTLTVQKLPLKITPKDQTVTYGEYVGGVQYDFDFGGAVVVGTLRDEVESAYRKYLAENALVVINGLSSPLSAATLGTLQNMSAMASFQSVADARKFLVQNGQMVPVSGAVAAEQAGAQRFLVDVSAQSLANYKTNPAITPLLSTPPVNAITGLTGAGALADGVAQASLPNGQLKPLVNGQLLPMVNGQLQAIVNGSLKAVVNGATVTAQDFTVQNGQLLASVNGVWAVATNGQIQAVVNGQTVTVDITVQNGQLQAVVNGQLMSVVNGQLQAVVNGQLLALVNGQLQVVVNGQLTPVVNGQLQVVVNGSLKPVVNGQLLALVNEQLVAADYVVIENGGLKALVNGQLRPLVNGQLLSVVNGQLLSMVNGQLLAVVNANGQDQVVFAVFTNGQLQVVVNGSLKPLVNGQLLAVVNGAVQNVTTYSITNGQLKATVNGLDYATVNGQLQAVVNGQLLPLVNNEGGVSATNNSNTAVVVDGADLTLQGGDLGGLFSVNMITGLSAGVQKLIPGTFLSPNFDVTYGTGEVTVVKAPLAVNADWKYVYQNSPTPTQSFYTSTVTGWQYGEPATPVTGIVYSLTPAYTGAPQVHVITPSGGTSVSGNYLPALYDTGRLYVNPYGSGTRKIIVQRECIRVLTAAETAQTGFRYEATYSYQNKNATPVYIPAGPDNYLSIDGGGSFKATLPEVFNPGTYYVKVLFTGQKMYWLVRSMDSDHKTAVTSDVDSGATKCSNAVTQTRQSARGEAVEATTLLSAYPNPARNRITVQADKPIVSERDVFVFDAAGKAYSGLLSVKRVSENALGITISPLPSGVYFVRAKTAEGYRMFRFTKL